jgi:hypothetical protein
MDPIAYPEELRFDLARHAHEGTSFVPEQRARQAQQAYADAVNGLYADLLEQATTDEQKALLHTEIQRYKVGYLQKYSAYLQAHARLISPMIAGPANFPVSRNAKRSRWADTKLTAFVEWDHKARAAIRRSLLDARTPEEKETAEWRALKSEITRSLSVILGIDTEGELWDRAAFTTSISGKVERLAHHGEVELVEKALAVIQSYNERHEKPAFTARHKIWSFPEVARAARESQARDADTPSTVIATGEGYAIEKNVQADRVQIFFDAKPAATLRDKLKSAGWKWSPSNNAWQRKLTEAAMDSAKSIVGISE